ncbi:hypothetical protein PoB_001499400 [Plakobranchus ocellatus]|uniref:Uncharacterized protein n=1 Tax=Plakobranchus ocellatus TaxID=259542 RepID=A0AAV3Z263_9GAST|nr:hypothetical protein PoB_001499400 [Plakobranchus ocellatus]
MANHAERRLWDLRPMADGSTSRVCGPLGGKTCSFACVLEAVIECQREFPKMHWEMSPLPGEIIFTGCRALAQALEGYVRAEKLYC